MMLNVEKTMVGLLFCGIVFVPGCSSLLSMKETDWRVVSDNPPLWHRQIIHHDELTQLYLTIVSGSLVFRWEKNCPPGAKEEKSIVMWTAGEYTTPFTRPCFPDDSDEVLVDRFAHDEFTRTLPKEARFVLNQMRQPSHVKPKDWI